MANARRFSTATAVKLVVNITWYLLFLYGAVLLLGVYPHFRDGHIFEVRFPTYNGKVEGLTTDNPEIAAPKLRRMNGEVDFETENFSYQMASLTPRLLNLLITLVIVHQLRCLFGNIASQDAFAHKNIQRIRNIGLATLAIEIFGFVEGLVLHRFIQSNLTLEGGLLHIKYQQLVDFKVIFLALVILSLAEVFRYGSQLKEDQALTV